MFLEETYLSLEITDYCNCSCIMCSQSVRSVIHGKSKGFMDYTMLKNLLEDLYKSDVKLYKVLPFGLGESLLHPQIKDILYLLKDYKDKGLILQIDLHTNAQILNRELQTAIVDDELLDTLSFSLDATSPSTYEKIRRHKGFRETMENVKSFLFYRKSKNTLSPKVILQLIAMEENQNEIDEFISYWGSFFQSLDIEWQLNFFWDPPMEKDTIFIKELNAFRPREKEIAPRIHRFFARKYGKVEEKVILEPVSNTKAMRKKVDVCSGPFKYISVAWDGTVTVCCIDTERELMVGNLTENSIREIWSGERINQIRRGLILKDYTECPRCVKCLGLDSPHLYEDELEKVKKELGLE